MSKKRLFVGCFFLVMIINVNTMHAQNNSDISTVLNTGQQSIVNISALTATGDLEKLKRQLNIGLDVGLTINEINEVLTQLYA